MVSEILHILAHFSPYNKNTSNNLSTFLEDDNLSKPFAALNRTGPRELADSG
jgi:hypothetical protein